MRGFAVVGAEVVSIASACLFHGIIVIIVAVLGFVLVAVLVVGVVKHFLGLLMFWFFFRMRLVFQLRWICYCCCCCISEFGY